LRRWLAKATHSSAWWLDGGVGRGWQSAWARAALEWIASKDEFVAEAGWSTLSCLVSLKDDADLDLAELKRLLPARPGDDGSSAERGALCDERVHDFSG
jgi:hypothetical protein